MAASLRTRWADRIKGSGLAVPDSSSGAWLAAPDGVHDLRRMDGRGNPLGRLTEVVLVVAGLVAGPSRTSVVIEARFSAYPEGAKGVPLYTGEPVVVYSGEIPVAMGDSSMLHIGEVVPLPEDVVNIEHAPLVGAELRVTLGSTGDVTVAYLGAVLLGNGAQLPAAEIQPWEVTR